MGINPHTDSQGKYLASTTLTVENGWMPGMVEQLQAVFRGTTKNFGCLSEIRTLTIDSAPNFGHLEVLMDDLIVRGIELIAHLEYFDTATNAWSLVPTNQPLAPNTKYKYSMRAGNEGCGSCENVYVKNVEFVVNRSSYDIKFFTDETYRVLLSFNPNGPQRLSSPIFPNVLPPHQYYSVSAGFSVSHLTPFYYVYFMVAQQINYNSKIFEVGVYAEIVPKGHYWREVKAS